MENWFNVQNSVAVFYYIYRTEVENNIVISTDAGKKFDKIKHLFTIETFKLIKGSDEKSPFNITLNSTFLLRSGTRKGCLLLPLLFNNVLEVLVWAISQESEIK